MVLSVRPLADDEVTAYLEGAVDRYAAQRMQSGEPEDLARTIATEQTGALFPNGKASPDHLLYRLLDENGAEVGMLWIGPHDQARPASWWVWYVEIDEPHRGRGFGRAAMQLAEVEARAHGANELGLNVFGGNVVARSLYESLGYETTAVNMRKEL
jgi:ribosomal protein S18 acetylase RimI-like enzyme